MATAAGAISGRCLCGAVRFATRGPAKREADVCHCAMCRRWSSGPFIGIGYDGEPIFEGAEHVGIYKSSEWAERGFCKRCGTALYWHYAGSDHYSFSVGALDDQSGFEIAYQIFIDEKPDYYELANDTPRLTGAEAMAAFEAGRADR
jgi:hypothetical protein